MGIGRYFCHQFHLQCSQIVEIVFSTFIDGCGRAKGSSNWSHGSAPAAPTPSAYRATSLPTTHITFQVLWPYGVGTSTSRYFGPLVWFIGNRLTPLAIAMNHRDHCHFKIHENLSFTRWTSYEFRSKLWFCYSSSDHRDPPNCNVNYWTSSGVYIWIHGPILYSKACRFGVQVSWLPALPYTTPI